MVYVVLSPAKTLDFRERRTGLHATMPHFQSRADELVTQLRDLSAKKLGDLMKLSPKLAQLNVARFNAFTDIAEKDIEKLQRDTGEQYAAAVLAYRGDTYQGLNATDLSDKDLQWAQNHVGILTGLYGVLRPLDLIQPYRLEMGTKLPVADHKDLYGYWGDTITDYINHHISAHDLSAVIGCASKEYLDAIQIHHLHAPFIQCDFKEHKDGTLKIVGLFAKRARGMMARYVIEKRVTDPEALKHFDFGGYRYEGALSSDNHFVFVR